MATGIAKYVSPLVQLHLNAYFIVFHVPRGTNMPPQETTSY